MLTRNIDLVNSEPLKELVVHWLERWPCKADSAQQWWLETNTLSVVSSLATLWLVNLPEKRSVPYIWA